MSDEQQAPKIVVFVVVDQDGEITGMDRDQMTAQRIARDQLVRWQNDTLVVCEGCTRRVVRLTETC